MNSTSRLGLALFGVAAAAAFVLGQSAHSAGTPVPAPSVVLRAAAAVGGTGKIEMRLRWSLADGWLPDGGFNLYRSDQSQPLNAAPLGGGTPSGPVSVGGNQSVNVPALLARATQIPMVSGSQIISAIARGPSAQSQFVQLAAQAQLHKGASTVVPAAVNAASGQAATAPAAGYAKTAASLATPHPRPSVAQVQLNARRTLLLSSALHPEVAVALGLQFDDTSVQPGALYTYTLRPINQGVEGGSVASVSIAVPSANQSSSSLLPAAPSGLTAAQLGISTVALRWQRLSSADESAMGIARYDVYRTVNGQTVQLNSRPVVVADAVDRSGGSTPSSREPVAFFTDSEPPMGNAAYSVAVSDIFGRTSPRVSANVTVQDWHTPPAPVFAAAQLLAPSGTATPRVRRAAPFHIAAAAQPPQSIQIAWTPSDTNHYGTVFVAGSVDTTIAYRVYRIDVESASQAPVLLTNTPVSGYPTYAAKLPAGFIQDALASAFCTALYTAPSGMAAQLAQSNCRFGAAYPNTAQYESYIFSGQNFPVFTYIDTTAAKDHYYRYLIKAVNPNNPLEVSSLSSNVVAYPNLTPPGAPGGLTSAFTKPAAGTATAPAPNATAVNWTGALVKAAPRDMGGTMVLKWTAPADAVKYEIYRANGTRPLPGKSSPANTSPTRRCAPAGAPTALRCSNVNVATAALSWQSIQSDANLKDSDFVLLGRVAAAQYDDQLSRSSANYYVYRVIPINRWNIAGATSWIAARAPATMAPTAPKLLLGTASPDGGAQVEYLPIGDQGEEVVRYELWRSLISTGLAPAAAGGVAAKPTHSSQPPILAKHLAVAPSAGNLAGSAARYGVSMQQPALSAAVRGGSGIVDTLTSSLARGQKVADSSAAALPAGSDQGAWFSDDSAGLDWRATYAYWVKAIDQDGLETASEPIDVTPLKISASAPAQVQAAWDGGRCAIALTWTRTDADTAGFIVERARIAPPSTGTHSGTTQSGQQATLGLSSAASLAPDDYAQISGSDAATPYADFSAFPNNTYGYRVRTLDKAGNLSAAATATPISVPDGCGPVTNAKPRPALVASASPLGDQASTPVVSPASPVAAKPADEITVPVDSPASPTAPKPADEITVPKRPTP